MIGRRTWVFPDAELPPAGEGELLGHESVIILNPQDEEARVRITLWFTDREPECFDTSVAARRVRCLRSNRPEDFGGIEVPEEVQYAIGLESTVPVVAQYGRLDVRQSNMAFYTTPGHSQ